MFQLLHFHLEGQVATITLNNGKVNAISHELIAEFHQALDQAEQAKAVVVMTGQAGIFSGGYDLKVMQSGNDAAMALVTEGSQLSRRLLAFPTPVIAACSGHAVAKGAFLLLSADVRIGVEGPYKIGLNEVAIGMTMHYAGIELARGRLPASYFNRSVLCAEMFDPKTAVTAGFLDMVVPEEQLAAQAQGLAAQLAKLDMTAHGNTKLKSRADFLEFLDEAIEKDRTGSL
ncbi:enoyl-CoA hydratase [Hahella sp. CCB-MM4]|uniref:crotonase/enoyl-CoA hydratase family protein n=1 Tax=Hahella sp. (strain CCB-MM4) TaxID=1926491 RepID=UPI000B9A7740|nr:crotonase/enoyl-CoA hydratase family protein [Hahella sp. CCB-MM4]OZG74231.1 enoyl-CoA hydratase [Hahella sp. CCB-MM4]